MEHPKIMPTIGEAAITTIGPGNHLVIADDAIRNSINLPLKIVATVPIVPAITVVPILADPLAIAGRAKMLLTATRTLDIDLLIMACAILATRAPMTGRDVAIQIDQLRQVRLAVSATIHGIVIRAIHTTTGTQTEIQDTDIRAATPTVIIDTPAILIAIIALRAISTRVIDRILPVVRGGRIRKTHAGKVVPRHSAAPLIQGQSEIFRGIAHKRSNLRVTTSVLTLLNLPSILLEQADFRITLPTDVTR